MITTLELVKKGQLNKFLDDIIPNNSNAKTVTLNKKEFEEKIRYKTQLTKQKIEYECFKGAKKKFFFKRILFFYTKDFDEKKGHVHSNSCPETFTILLY